MTDAQFCAVILAALAAALMVALALIGAGFALGQFLGAS